MQHVHAEIALLGRILYKFKNTMGRRFRVYQRMKEVFDLSRQVDQDQQKIGLAIRAAVMEITSLLSLGHNLQFLLVGLAVMSRLMFLLERREQNDSIEQTKQAYMIEDEDMGERL